MLRCVVVLGLLVLAGCGVVRAGGQYSGVPDGTVGNWPISSGTVSTGGTIVLDRERPPRL